MMILKVCFYSVHGYITEKLACGFAQPQLSKGTTVNKAQERIIPLMSVYLLKNKYKIKYT